MADRSDKYAWGTCDGCGVDLGAVCCYSPHQYGEYDTLCGTCFTVMKREVDAQRTIECGGSPVGGKANGVKKRGRS